MRTLLADLFSQHLGVPEHQVNMLLVLLWSCLSGEKCTEAFDQTYETGTIERGSICEARVYGRHVDLSAPSHPVYPNYILRITFYSESRNDNKFKIVKIT